MDMSTMASAVKNLPQYQQLMTDLGRHVAITSMCLKEFNNQNLINLAAVEQTLSTGALKINLIHIYFVIIIIICYFECSLLFDCYVVTMDLS